ncbi:ATP-binding protein [Nonomuraea sp. ZG12]|uniref:ATP-binding protein n=1 Tax=Nonomuraea sp. ZG12 TaxID=3452207 RepID=UPI003F8B76FD
MTPSSPETIDPGSHRLELRFPGIPSQVARARSLVTAVLGRDHPLHDDCVLLTSELATNAILHSRSGAGGEFTVTVLAARDVVRVCVEDAGSEEPPCACRANAQSTGGRGLPLLEALSHRWGFTRGGGRTAVWFELPLVTVPAGWAV